MNIYIEMLEMADNLDQKGLHREADAMEDSILRLAELPGWPSHSDLPYGARVMPWGKFQKKNKNDPDMPGDVEEEMRDMDKSRNEHFRLHPQYDNWDDPEDVDDREGTIFEMNSPEGDGVTGPRSIYQDPQSPGFYKGNMKPFEYENRTKNDNAADRYKNLVPRS